MTKTKLWRDKELAFEFSGIHHATLDQQLEGFSLALIQASGSLPLAKPDSWLKAFEMLKQYLTPLVKTKQQSSSWMSSLG